MFLISQINYVKEKERTTLEISKVIYDAHFSSKSFFFDHLSVKLKKKESLKYQIGEKVITKVLIPAKLITWHL